jgi:prepilin-type N-terminal cleavage/methylation domain-containing protein
MNTKNIKGFTIIEIMIVISILGIVLAIAILNYNESKLRLKRSGNEAYRIGEFLPIMEKASPGTLIEFTNGRVQVVTHVLPQKKMIVLRGTSGVYTLWNMTNLAMHISSSVPVDGEGGIYILLSKMFIWQSASESRNSISYFMNLESSR